MLLSYNKKVRDYIHKHKYNPTYHNTMSKIKYIYREYITTIGRM
jgi:hypothetical protein